MWSPWIKHGGDGVPVVDGTNVKVFYEDSTQAIMTINTQTWREAGSSWHWGSRKRSGERWKRITHYQVWNHPMALKTSLPKMLEVYK